MSTPTPDDVAALIYSQVPPQIVTSGFTVDVIVKTLPEEGLVMAGLARPSKGGGRRPEWIVEPERVRILHIEAWLLKAGEKADLILVREASRKRSRLGI